MLFKKKQSGFTLLEVMLSITVLSLLMVSVFTITNNSIESKERIISEDRDYLQIQTALDRFERDISQIFSPLYFTIPLLGPNTPGLQGEDIFEEKELVNRFQPSEKYPSQGNNKLPIPAIINDDPQSFSFKTSAHRRTQVDIPQSRYAWVNYKLQAITPDLDLEVSESQSGTQEWVRGSVAANPYSKDFLWDEVRHHTLLKGVKEFKYEFWDVQNKKFVSLLRETNRDIVTPRLIRVSFTWVSKTGDEFPISRTFRPLWPFFDREAEQAMLVRFLREQADARRRARTGEPPPEGQQDEFGGFDSGEEFQ